MKLTIDNYDGLGARDYTGAIVAGRPFRILRRLNEPVTCAVTLLPAASLPAPARSGRMIVTDDSGTLLFTGYVATDPALELAGQGSMGAVYSAVVTAVSDDILLSRQPLPQTPATAQVSGSQAFQALLAHLQTGGVASQLANSVQTISQFQADAGRSWAENAGELAFAIRNAWRLMDGTLTLTPVGFVTHNLSESQGMLSLSSFELSMLEALANDVTVCGQIEPCAYVTEYFQGDGTTLIFNLTEDPYAQPASQRTPLVDTFNEPAINPSFWMVDDPGARLSITSNGLTCTGGNGGLGTTMVSALSQLELGGSLVLETASVLFGAQTDGILNGLYPGDATLAAHCFLGFQVSQSNNVTSIAPLVNGAAAGTAFTPTAGHLYTLRLRLCVPEVERALQAYYVVAGQSGMGCYGGTSVSSGGSALLEVQDVTNGIAGAPQVLWSGSVTPAATCIYAPLNSSLLQCSIGSVTVERQGPQWVVNTPPSGSPVVRRIGTPAQGADCKLSDAGRLTFYAGSTPAAGETIAVSYRTRHRSVARLANTASIEAESKGGALPGTACWMGTITSPAPRTSADCENAAAALLDVATNRAAAWRGTYTGWNLEQQSDVWPGDVLAISSASAGVTANVVVRTVQIDVEPSAPSLVKYTIGFANDWAEQLAIRSTAAVPADVWLPLQPETAPPLASLNALTVTSVTGSAISIAANVAPPAGGGFEVRRRDWSFTPGPGPDLVLRTSTPSFSFPREAVTEQYYIRMYDASTPPNYSRFSAAVFVNLPLTA